MQEDIEDLKIVLRMNREIAQYGITGGTLEALMGEAAEAEADPDPDAGTDAP